MGETRLPDTEPDIDSAPIPLDRPIGDLYRSREALAEAARVVASGVDPAFQHSVYLYYIARYLVSVYEARYLELPIQVWNEYRNALDHFMRHLSAQASAENRAPHHLHKMEGHLQRAVLDVSKILCIKSHEAISENIDIWGYDALDLIDSGNFTFRIKNAQKDAITLFERAKINDSQLGHDRDINAAIIENFLDAFFKFDEVIREILQKHLTLINAKRQILAMNRRADEASRRQAEEIRAEIRPRALLFNLFFGILMAIFGWWLGITFPPTPPVASPAPIEKTAPPTPTKGTGG